MSDQGFKPVRHDGKKALEKAMQRPGFKEAWEAGADEYAALHTRLGVALHARAQASSETIHLKEAADAFAARSETKLATFICGSHYLISHAA